MFWGHYPIRKKKPKTRRAQLSCKRFVPSPRQPQQKAVCCPLHQNSKQIKIAAWYPESTTPARENVACFYIKIGNIVVSWTDLLSLNTIGKVTVAKNGLREATISLLWTWCRHTKMRDITVYPLKGAVKRDPLSNHFLCWPSLRSDGMKAYLNPWGSHVSWGMPQCPNLRWDTIKYAVC